MENRPQKGDPAGSRGFTNGSRPVSQNILLGFLLAFAAPPFGGAVVIDLHA